MYIDLLDFDDGSWQSYLAITPQGVFVFGGLIYMDATIKGYKVTTETTAKKLHSALTHREIYNDVFDDRVPFVRRPSSLSDVMICTHE